MNRVSGFWDSPRKLHSHSHFFPLISLSYFALFTHQQCGQLIHSGFTVGQPTCRSDDTNAIVVQHKLTFPKSINEKKTIALPPAWLFEIGCYLLSFNAGKPFIEWHSSKMHVIYWYVKPTFTNTVQNKDQ